MASTLIEARRELALANRIVANEGVIDAFGHVSMRHPDNPSRYLLSRSRAPELVTPDDFIEYDLDSQPQRDPGVGQYSERVIHGEIYKARPEVNSVCHHHCPAFMPLLATGTDYMPVFHLGAIGGIRPPFWDQRDEFGDTNLLVTNMPQGRDLALRLGVNNVSLMRGHGFVAAARSLIEVVRMSVYVPRNARVQMAALQLGAVKPLSPGEIAARNAGYKPHSPETWRAWEYWATQAGCAELLGKD